MYNIDINFAITNHTQHFKNVKVKECLFCMVWIDHITLKLQLIVIEQWYNFM